MKIFGDFQKIENNHRMWLIKREVETLWSKCWKELATNCTQSNISRLAFQSVFFEIRSNFAHFFWRDAKVQLQVTLCHLQSNPTLLQACTTSGQYTNLILTPTFLLKWSNHFCSFTMDKETMIKVLSFNYGKQDW